jgi:ketosteroid isomerase-like protein
MKFILSLGLLLLFTNPSEAADLAAEVESWNEQFYSAWRSRDIETIADLYTEDAEVIWIYEQETAHGREEFKDLLKWEFSFPSVEVEVEQLSQSIYELADGMLLVLDISNQTFDGPDGKPMKVKIRSLAWFKRIEGRLQVAIEHSSIAQPWGS